MQTSKITVGSIYAVRVGGQLARLRVLRIVTMRNMSGTASRIEGELLDATDGRPAGYEITYEPGDIIGDYKDVAELAEKERLEREKREAEATRKADRAEAIFTAFCKLIGAPKPKKVKNYRHSDPDYPHDAPFRVSYGNRIEINHEGMDILAKFLKVDQEQEEPTTNVVNLNP